MTRLDADVCKGAILMDSQVRMQGTHSGSIDRIFGLVQLDASSPTVDPYDVFINGRRRGCIKIRIPDLAQHRSTSSIHPFKLHANLDTTSPNRDMCTFFIETFIATATLFNLVRASRGYMFRHLTGLFFRCYHPDINPFTTLLSPSSPQTSFRTSSRTGIQFNFDFSLQHPFRSYFDACGSKFQNPGYWVTFWLNLLLVAATQVLAALVGLQLKSRSISSVDRSLVAPPAELDSLGGLNLNTPLVFGPIYSILTHPRLNLTFIAAIAQLIDLNCTFGHLGLISSAKQPGFISTRGSRALILGGATGSNEQFFGFRLFLLQRQGMLDCYMAQLVSAILARIFKLRVASIVQVQKISSYPRNLNCPSVVLDLIAAAALFNATSGISAFDVRSNNANGGNPVINFWNQVINQMRHELEPI
ncbi:hypothetical protein DFH06DRAFT_1126090 [Mycena polygramma]|nr:hypothetical protein DFH06DRAFT_1126090 [Mycena polygramma]